MPFSHFLTLPSPGRIEESWRELLPFSVFLLPPLPLGGSEVIVVKTPGSGID